MTGFPLVFAAICLVIGLVSVWRNRETVRVLASTALLLASAAVPVAGYLQHYRVVRASEARVQALLAVSLTATSPSRRA
jgi:NADH:ubiquinone oxidoreductase subunit K